MPKQTTITPELQQFLDLANQTDGMMDERTAGAYELAQAALENAMFLNESALRGFVIFLSVAKVDPEQAGELLEDE